MADQAFFLAPSTVNVNFTILPVDNINQSMMIMLQAEERSGVADWLVQTYRKLSPEQRETHEMILDGLFAAMMVDDVPDEYPAYLDRLSQCVPEKQRDSVLDRIIDTCACYGVEADYETLLKDEESFMDIITRGLRQKYDEKGYMLHSEIYQAVFPLLKDPPAMMAVIVDHLRYMWRVHCKAEWERNLPTLKEALAAFEQMDYRGLTALEAVRAVTGRDVSAHWPDINRIEKITFVPSMHIGPYIGYDQLDAAGKAYKIYFGAHIPRGVTTQSTALTRSDLLVRISALADDTRLSILDLLTKHDELCAQDIMTRLELSQSSASRHLRQLTASGYLIERRRDVAKCYSLNRERIDDTLDALRRYLNT